MKAYATIRNELDTGDIVLFSGKGGISSAIKWFTGSKWSHVGMVLRIPEWDTVLLWESTTLPGLKDIETGKVRQGVQLVALSERLDNYDGEVMFRLLETARTDEMKLALMNLRAELKGRPYEKSKLELLKAAYDGPLGASLREDLSSLFCSELVAEAYQAMQLLPDDPPSNEYTPADFSSDTDTLQLLQNATLGPEITVVR